MINFKRNKAGISRLSMSRGRRDSAKTSHANKIEKLWSTWKESRGGQAYSEGWEAAEKQAAWHTPAKKSVGQNGDEPDGRLEKKDGERAKKVDIGRYHDPEGLTVKKMEIGLWLARNRRHIRLATGVILGIISAVTWFISFYYFGYYIVYGMKNDQFMINKIVTLSTVGHDFFVTRQPRNLQFQKVQIIKSDGDKYDLVVRLQNPNRDYVARFIYYFSAQGENIERANGFILPNETKYFSALSKKLSSGRASATFSLEELRWLRLDKHRIPDWEEFRRNHLNIVISDIKFLPARPILSEELNLNNLHFTAVNNTAYNYRQVVLNIFLFERSEISAVNRFVLSNFMSGETRNVDIVWPGRFGWVDNVVVSPEIDILRNDVYINFIGGPGEEK